MEAISQGRPSPRKTLTEFEPVTFPTALSALLSCNRDLVLSFFGVFPWSVSGYVPSAGKTGDREGHSWLVNRSRSLNS